MSIYLCMISISMYMLILVFVLSISLINAKSTPYKVVKNRVTRALPPKYLSVEGFKSCLVNYAEETSFHWCFPLKKLPGCPSKVWNELGDAYKAQNVETFVGGLEGLPPTYLQVNHSIVKQDKTI